MTNIWGTPGKKPLRDKLFQAAVDALEDAGWKVETIRRSGKSSVRQITKGKTVKKVTIRTSQDTWIAFPRNARNDGWATLDDVDYVVASTVDDRQNPRFVQVHMIDADEMRERFDRTYAARKAAKYKLPHNRGIWVSLYDEELSSPVTLVGAGAGLAHPPIKRVPLTGQNANAPSTQEKVATQDIEPKEPLSISEAKRRLALSLGVDESNITITING
jgi:hypothetical protein